MNACIVCGKKPKRASYKYCSNKCQQQNQYFEYIKSWKTGEFDSSRGKVTKNISKYLRRYLLEKFRNSCQMCGWNKRNSVTGKVPLEVDHIDGDSESNIESNLRLVCPNCHSLSPNFRNLNKGNGRSWRLLKYIKN